MQNANKLFYFIFYLSFSGQNWSQSKERASLSEKQKQWGEFRELNSHRDTPNHHPQVNFSLCLLVLIFIISFMKLYTNFYDCLGHFASLLLALTGFQMFFVLIMSWLCLLKLSSLVEIICGVLQFCWKFWSLM